MNPLEALPSFSFPYSSGSPLQNSDYYIEGDFNESPSLHFASLINRYNTNRAHSSQTEPRDRERASQVSQVSIYSPPPTSLLNSRHSGQRESLSGIPEKELSVEERSRDPEMCFAPPNLPSVSCFKAKTHPLVRRPVNALNSPVSRLINQCSTSSTQPQSMDYAADTIRPIGDCSWNLWHNPSWQGLLPLDCEQETFITSIDDVRPKSGEVEMCNRQLELEPGRKNGFYKSRSMITYSILGIDQSAGMSFRCHLPIRRQTRLHRQNSVYSGTRRRIH